MSEITGYLKKQPSWKIIILDGKIHTGWCDGYQTWRGGVQVVKDVVESKVPIIKAKLTLEKWGRGRSSAIFYFKDESGHIYEAAMQASFEMFKNSVKGVIEGEFTFKKQGTQISIAPYSEG